MRAAAPDSKILRERYAPKELRVLKPDRQLGVVRFSPCGSWLVAGGTDGTLRRWRMLGDEAVELPGSHLHDGWVQTLGFDRTGACGFSADSWGRLTCWDPAGDALEPNWTLASAHDGWIRALAVSPDGTRLATAGRDGAVRLWSTADGTRLAELAGHDADLFSLAFRPDGTALVSGDLMGHVIEWDVATGKTLARIDATVLHKLDRLQDVGGVRALAFDPGGTRLACAGTRPRNGGNVQGVPTVLFFDAASGNLESSLAIGNDGDGFVFDLAWHPDDFLLGVTSGNPGVGKLFFARPGDDAPFFQTAIPNCHSLALHPAHSLLAIAATNANSNGNGRKIGKSTEYPGNTSPLHLWSLARPVV